MKKMKNMKKCYKRIGFFGFFGSNLQITFKRICFFGFYGFLRGGRLRPAASERDCPPLKNNKKTKKQIIWKVICKFEQHKQKKTILL